MGYHKTYFLRSDICLKLYVPHYTSHCFKTFPHIYATSFSIKTSFHEINNTYTSRIKQNYTKPLNVFKSKLQIKVISHWILFKILLTSAMIFKQDIFAWKRDCNVIKTTNPMTLIKNILESLFKVLWTSRKNNYPKTTCTFIMGRSVLS